MTHSSVPTDRRAVPVAAALRMIACVLAVLGTACVMVLPAIAEVTSLEAPATYDNPVWSPDGHHLAMSGGNDRGVYVLAVETGTCVRITDAPGSGYAFNWSPDGKRLGFKLLLSQSGGSPLHQPAVFEVGKNALTRLCEPTPRAGVPSFSADGKIAYTVDRELRVVRAGEECKDSCITTYKLSEYANLAPISPDGLKVAFNDESDAIHVLNLGTGTQKAVTPTGVGCFGPVWSPDSRRLAVNTTGGKLMSIEVDSGRVWELGEGGSASWMPDNETLCYTRSLRQDGVRLIDSAACRIRFDGTAQARLTAARDGLEASARISADGGRLAYVNLRDGRLYQRRLNRITVTDICLSAEPATAIVPDSVAVQDLCDSLGTRAEGPNSASVAMSADSVTVANQVRLSRPCPYVHQVYDTPNAFNGNWACGATSAIQAIQYYELLPAWNVTVSTPYTHVSPFGQYVSATYTYNGYTYNIGSPDPNGRLGYGGYGYIVRNDWADTKGYMRDYFLNHGIQSSVDWSPTWAELKAEINADHPFVLLNSLTTAGHYITTVGYFDNDAQRTAIFNDPYGNKNTPGYPSYDGAGACYDWPGYSNGYQNLKTVHCFIYARAGWPPTITQHPTDRNSARGAVTTFNVAAQGLGPISYRWQKNGVPMTDGGRYSGVTTNALTITSVQSSDTGQYRCVVANTYGSVTSDEAQLTMIDPDFDGDHDVDSEDFGHMQICLDMPGTPAAAGCADADLDGDGDVDTYDFARFQPCFAGPGAEMPTGCAY